MIITGITNYSLTHYSFKKCETIIHVYGGSNIQNTNQDNTNFSELINFRIEV